MQDNSIIHSSIHATDITQQFLRENCDRPEFKNYCVSLSEEFFNFLKSLGHEWDNPYSKVFSLDDKKITFMHLIQPTAVPWVDRAKIEAHCA